MAINIPIVTQFDNKGIKKAMDGFSKLENNAKKASSALKKVGQAAVIGFAAVGAAIAGAAYAGWDFAKAAMEDEKSAALLANALKNTTKATDAQIKSTEDFISKMSLASGVADDELRPALATIARSTKSLSKAQKLLGTAQNIAAATGKPLAQTAKAVAAAYAGQFGQLKKLSPEIAKLIKGGASVDQVFAALDKTFKGASDTAANTTAGRMARLKVAFDEIKESIGYFLLPVLGTLADFLTNTVAPAFEEFQKQVKKDGFVTTLKDYITRGLTWLVTDGIPTAVKKAKEFADAFVKWIKPRWKPFLTALGVFLKRFGRWIVDDFIPWIGKNFPKWVQAFSDWFEKNAEPMMKGLIKAFIAIELWMLTKGYPMFIKLGAIILVALVKGMVSNTFTVIKAVGNILLDLAKQAGSKAIDAGKSLGKSLVNGMISGLNLLIDQINSMLEIKVNLPFGKSYTFNPKDIPHIPKLAEGGIVTSPTLALIGEAGPEAVVPLSGNNTPMGGGITINISTGVGDPVAIGREVQRVMAAYSRRAA
jgi:hypothetical protein